MEASQDKWWHSEFAHSDDESVDYLSRDQRTAVEVKDLIFGSRGLYSAIMPVAIYLERNPEVKRAYLVLNQTRMSLRRLKEEWQYLKKVLRIPIAQRLCLIAVDKDTWLDPDDRYSRRIAQFFELAAQYRNDERGETLPQLPRQKVYEVWKVLISRWLQREEPIAIGELTEQVGCSYPTVRTALAKPSIRHAVQTTSNRAVELRAFPHDAWRELTALSISQRTSVRFRDRSGEKQSPLGLLKRLERDLPPRLAVGGVIAARHWYPDFDLHGTPRLDLVYHAPLGKVDLDFVRRLDPALTRVHGASDSAVLVIHGLIREAPLFVDKKTQGIPWADPVETALELHDLALTAQANEMLTHLRRRCGSNEQARPKTTLRANCQ